MTRLEQLSELHQVGAVGDDQRLIASLENRGPARHDDFAVADGRGDAALLGEAELSRETLYAPLLILPKPCHCKLDRDANRAFHRSGWCHD